MNANHIESKFAMMGARLKVRMLPERRMPEDYAVDIQKYQRMIKQDWKAAQWPWQALHLNAE